MAKVDAASGLKPLYSFDQLVIGPHNQVAVGACMEVVKAPGDTYNPLFVYGPPGVGKTHLMQAVAHQLLEQNPNFNIRYISAERFMSEILTAISEDRMLDVRRTYSTLDLLVIDDVQYMTESKISQEELFHVFNNMHQANRQVILAADRPPNQLTTLNKNIRSRLEWGLSADIRVPEEHTRVEILKKKQLNSPGLQMTEDMFIFVARNLRSNVRELEGFLKRVHAYVSLSHQELTMELVKSVVREILPEGTPEVNVSEPPTPPKNGHTNGHSAPVAAAPPPPPPPAPPPPAPPAIPKQDRPVMDEKPVERKPAPLHPDSVVFAPKAPESTMSFDLILDAIPEIEQSQPAAAAPAPVKRAEPSAPKPPPPPVARAKEPEAIKPAAAKPAPPPVPAPEPIPVPELAPETDESGSDEEAGAHKEVGAVFFFPEGCENELNIVVKKFQEVIKKHKLKFRLKGAHNQPYVYKGKINYTSFVDVCKTNKVPVAIVIGPPPENFLPQQDFYDLLTVTLDVQGVSLQLVNWSEINKDYRYLNLALDIALVRSR